MRLLPRILISMDLSSFDANPFLERRRRLASALGDQAALIAAGLPSPRNYLANAYPYRAASHFLYLFGLPLRGAFGSWNGSSWTVFAPEPDPASALWHGTEPTLADLAGALGCAVASLDELTAVVAASTPQTLPAADFRTCTHQTRLLRRPLEPGTIDAADHALELLPVRRVNTR